MRRRLIALSLAALWPIVAAGTPQAGALPLGEVDGPAELPPPGYSADRYVDSRGCVFLRAGYGENVVWVPRVTRDRKLLCGQPPSLGGAAALPARQDRKGAAAVAAASSGGAKAAPGPAPASAATRAAAVPAGFRPAWTDGRLNPLRGPRSAQGDRAMSRIWSSTVPRRLLAGGNGAGERRR